MTARRARWVASAGRPEKYTLVCFAAADAAGAPAYGPRYGGEAVTARGWRTVEWLKRGTFA